MARDISAYLAELEQVGCVFKGFDQGLVDFYGKQGGKDFRGAADIILRRVNDVPGSTEEQRRWHIERIDLKS